jgi:hypothetical protein
VAEKSKREKEAEIVGFVGVGLDNEDGHRRLTQGKNFVLVGGSEATHEKMTDTAVHVNEKLRKRGKRLQDASIEEILDLFHRAAS